MSLRLSLLSALVAISTVSVAVPARALPTNAVYTAVLGGSPVGTLQFSFDQEVWRGCRYVADWEFGSGVPGEQCSVDEAKSFGHESCWTNALRPINSLVLDAAGEPCWGLDATGQSNSVFTLILAERGSDGALDGVMQLDTATSSVVSFHAAPAS